MATVTGPASSTDTAITRWNGTSGSVVQDSTVLIDAAGNITEVTSIGVGSNGVGGAGCYIDGSGNVGSYGYISAQGDLSTNADMTANGTVTASRIKSTNGLIDTNESTGAIIATQLVAANSGSNIAFVAGGGMSGTYVVTTTATNSATTLNLSGNADISGTNTGDQTITLTGDVTGSGTGSFVTTIKSSVALAGSPTTTTQTAGDNSTKIATTAYVNSAVAAGSGPAYTSSQQTITASSVITLAHGLAAAPSFVTVGLVCVTANLNYAVGDVIALPYAFYFNGAGTTNTNVGYQIAYNATDIFITTSSAMIVCNKTTGTLSNITYADWKYVVKAWN